MATVNPASNRKNASQIQPKILMAKRDIKGVRLTVDVGLGHVIKVDQGQPSHAAARERFHTPRAHTADTDHTSVGHGQGSGRVRTVQTIDATKTTLGIHLDTNSSRRSVPACTYRTHHDPAALTRAAFEQCADCRARHRGLAH